MPAISMYHLTYYHEVFHLQGVDVKVRHDALLAARVRHKNPRLTA